MHHPSFIRGDSRWQSGTLVGPANRRPSRLSPHRERAAGTQAGLVCQRVADQTQPASPAPRDLLAGVRRPPQTNCARFAQNRSKRQDGRVETRVALQEGLPDAVSSFTQSHASHPNPRSFSLDRGQEASAPARRSVLRHPACAGGASQRTDRRCSPASRQLHAPRASCLGANNSKRFRFHRASDCHGNGTCCTQL